jgi:hypothetical protein
MSTTLFVFLDESGNFDFSLSGTKHLVFTAVISTNPIQSASRILDLKYQLLQEGLGIGTFHASEDRQLIRDRVFSAIAEIREMTAHTFWIDKRSISGQVVEKSELFSAFSIELFNVINQVRGVDSYDRLVFVFDKFLLNKEELAFRSIVTPKFSLLEKPFEIYFHNVYRDPNGQIADYIAWAHFVSLERLENRPKTALPKSASGLSKIKL